MTEIEERIEARSVHPNYAAVKFTEKQIAAGEHRRFVGGRWDTHGRTQLDFLTSQGLRPSHRMLDIGCGSLRAGRLFIDYLDPGNYYGVDASRSVIQAGYDIELSDAQRTRLPATNLRANDRFDGDFGVKFDFALAQSVFSHVSLNHIQLCLYRVGKVMKPGGIFFATFIERDSSAPIDTIFAADQPKPYYHERNAYWYHRRDLRWSANSGPWRFQYIGDWGHPGGQNMIKFTRLTEGEVAEREARRAQKQERRKLARRPQTASPESPGLVGRGRRWISSRIAPKP